MQNRSNIQLNSELIRKKTTLMPVNLTKTQIYARPTKNNPNNQLINFKKILESLMDQISNQINYEYNQHKKSYIT